MIQEFVQEIQKNIDKSIRGVHTSFPGIIEKYDPGTGLCDVTPVMRFRKPDESYVAYPKITGVPALFPRSASSVIAFPVKSGDGCLVIVSEQSLDYWMYGHETASDLPHDLTNAVCIPGLFARANSVISEACTADAVIVDTDGTRITVRRDCISMEADGAVITVSGDCISMDAKRIELTADEVTVNADVTVAGTLTADSIDSGETDDTDEKEDEKEDE